MKATIFSTVLICTLFINLSFSQKSEKDDPSRWTPKDVINTEYLGNSSFSPDGNMVVWTKRRGVKDKDRFVSDIYLTRLNKQEDGVYHTIQLTNKDETDFSPLFSRDGEHIYFLSSRDKGKKLWKMSIYGGEAKEVKEFKNGISSISWKNDNTLLFRSNEGKSLWETELSDKKDNVVVVEDTVHWKPSRIYAYDLDKGDISRLTDNAKPVGSYSISKDGNWLFYTMARNRSYAADAQKDPFNYIKDLNSGRVRKIIDDRGFPIFNVQFSADNRGFYFLSQTASDPEWNGAGISELYYYTIATNSYEKVPLNWELGIRTYRVSGNSVIATLANRATYRLAYYQKTDNGWSKKPFDMGEKNDHAQVLAITQNSDKILYNYSTASRLPSYHVADLKDNRVRNETELVKLNSSLSKKAITKSEVITWKGYKDEEVTGILYYPENYEAGKKYPLMLSIHGGPASQDTDLWSERWSTYPNILAQRGAFVLKPNYHGSANHGLEYVEAIKGNYYEPEMEDIIKGIDMLAQKGMIDKDQMGTMGWSNGAIITTMLTVRYPDMFKVAAPGAGDVNWTSDFGTCRFGVSFDQSYFGGAPWDDVDGKFYNENYIVKSPLFELDKVKTPTIIFHGSEDRAVPRDQGWEYYRALQQVGKTPVRFLWFPGQPHGLRKITHQLRKINEELAWIDTYLFNKPPEKNEAFKESSPLAELLKIQESKSSNGFFGEMINGVLAPETLPIAQDSISIGKFEVTNAQFKAFRDGYEYEAGLDNYPAVVSSDDAKSYVTWLSDKTGATYRLPNAKEAEELHQKAFKAASGELTLNYWAGYSITLDEVPLLREKLKELKTPLFKKVGKKKPTKVGEAEVYDLGGNVAEYFTEGVYGYSAYDFYDSHNSGMIDSQHVGIRVIKENSKKQ